MAVRELKPVKGPDSCHDRPIPPVPPPRPLKGMTLPLIPLWKQVLDKAVRQDVLKILSRIAARPAETDNQNRDGRTPAAAIGGAARQPASNLANAANRENGISATAETRH